MALYAASYVDERERVERVLVDAASAAEALREARGEVRRRADEARRSYAAKGIRLRIHRAQYIVLMLVDERGYILYRHYNPRAVDNL